MRSAGVGWDGMGGLSSESWCGVVCCGQAVAGHLLPAEGVVRVHPRESMGYLVQTAVSGSDRPLVAEVMSQMTRWGGRLRIGSSTLVVWCGVVVV
jgi:hypothetical protein